MQYPLEVHARYQVQAGPKGNESHAETLMGAWDILEAIAKRGEIPALSFTCDLRCQGSRTCSCPQLWDALTQTAQIRGGVEPWATEHVLYWGAGPQKSQLWWKMRWLSTRKWNALQASRAAAEAGLDAARAAAANAGLDAAAHDRRRGRGLESDLSSTDVASALGREMRKLLIRNAERAAHGLESVAEEPADKSSTDVGSASLGLPIDEFSQLTIG